MASVQASAVTVRRATASDLADVVALRLALLREYRDNPLYRRLRSDAGARAAKLFATQLESPHEAIFLAQRDRASVGILRCVHSRGSPLLRPAEYGYISSVYVVPGERRSGVLRRLHEEAVHWCRERGLAELRLHNDAQNPAANAAWSALGFEVVEVLRLKSLEG